ncbi:MAG: hypothetical protein LDL01_01080 [Ignavibacterium sp.]|nr:hypothetical protein [Ignavibacterium sp.]
MRTSKFVLWLSAILIFALITSGCNTNSQPTQPLEKNSKLLLKVANKSINNSINSTNGSIVLSSFNINLSKLSLQENSGVDGEQEGEHNDGDNENGGSETEMPDIVLNGPLSFDIALGSVELGNVDVYAGTFKKVDLNFSQTSTAPFNNHSIIVTGNYKKSNGENVPFTIKSKFSKTYETLIANGGITVNTNSTVPVTIIFNFDNIFKNIDLSNAVVSNGTIIIDEQNNSNLLQVFENNLNNSVEVEN